jgi:hypothetical protein
MTSDSENLVKHDTPNLPGNRFLATTSHHHLPNAPASIVVTMKLVHHRLPSHIPRLAGERFVGCLDPLIQSNLWLALTDQKPPLPVAMMAIHQDRLYPTKFLNFPDRDWRYTDVVCIDMLHCLSSSSSTELDELLWRETWSVTLVHPHTLQASIVRPCRVDSGYYHAIFWFLYSKNQCTRPPKL